MTIVTFLSKTFYIDFLKTKWVYKGQQFHNFKNVYVLMFLFTYCTVIISEGLTLSLDFK